jgi:hypothetical protein
MKIIKFGLRFWITLGSVFSFLFGWAIFSHSLKPAQPVSHIASLPTLAPLPPMNTLGSDPALGFQQSQQPSFNQSFFRPRFMTGGS